MQSHKNNIIIASAGGRKTTFIVEDALKNKNRKILITTYTTENLEQITSYIVERNGCIPSNITVISWFTFLLHHGVWPYQTYILSGIRVVSIDFKTISAPLQKGGRANPSWYINKGNFLYKDRVTEFVCDCNARSEGLIIKRLEKIYDDIYIDEMQDFVGWDQELIELLMRSSISVNLVGDPRQSTYMTNNSSKNKGQKGKNITTWIDRLQKNSLCQVEERTECFRCNQIICDFADDLYPDLARTVSKNAEETGHDGIFTILRVEVPDYISTHNPKILRWDRRANTMNFPAMNIGISKGRTYERVVIFPTKPMKLYLKTKNIDDAGDISKLYVAVTRAKYSVTFVMD
ncbi:MAG: DNA helicase II [Candidatus Woesebacteria bacterium]